ncbi:unnamed protein product [Sphagnum balticum]
MLTFEMIEKHGTHEQVVFCYDRDCGLKAIIAIHNTTLGPALGGTRMWPYKSEEEALVDVLRLSKGMTYKAAAAGLNLGGGKAVIIGDPKKDKTEALFRTFGAHVNSLNGKYITAEDVGTTVHDMSHVFMETPYVTGIPVSFGGSGDPSPFTAHGVLMGIKASVKDKLGADSLNGVRVAVQGLGSVGSHLIEYLVKEGAEVVVADIDPERVKKICAKFSLPSISSDSIVTSACDVFAPCALGAVFRISRLEHIATHRAADRLAEKRIKSIANLPLSYATYGYVALRREQSAAEAIYRPEAELKKAQSDVLEARAKKMQDLTKNKKPSDEEMVRPSDFNKDFAVVVDKVKAQIKAHADTKAAFVSAMNLSYFLIEQKQYPEALAALDLVTYKPSNGSLLEGFGLMHRGLALGENSQLEAALETYQNVLKSTDLKVFYPEALLKTGVLYQQKGDRAKAIDAYERLTHEFPEGEATTKAKQYLRLIDLKLHQQG